MTLTAGRITSSRWTEVLAVVLFGVVLVVIAAELAPQAPGEGSRGRTPGKEWAPWAST